MSQPPDSGTEHTHTRKEESGACAIFLFHLDRLAHVSLSPNILADKPLGKTRLLSDNKPAERFVLVLLYFITGGAAGGEINKNKDKASWY